MTPANPASAARRPRPLRAIAVWCAVGATAGLAAAVAVSVGAADRGGHLPPDNLVRNASFEPGTRGWTGTRLSHVFSPAAPDGAFVARAAAQHGRVAIDNWPGSVTATTAGTTYTARAEVAAATPSTAGRRVDLVLREHRPDGNAVASWTSPLRLDRSFRDVRVNGTAHANGDYIDVYVAETAAGAGDAVYVDAVSLVARSPLPVTNELANPSFERSVSPWRAGGGVVARARTANAPDGAYVARVCYRGSAPTLSIGDQLATARTVAGQRYRASILAASSASSGVRLVAREITPSGTVVAAFRSAETRLQRDFVPLALSAVARNDGDLLALSLVDPHPARAEVLDVDAASLAAAPSSIAELAIGSGQAAHLGDTSRYRYVIIQEYAHAEIAAIKRADPHTEVLAYLNAASVKVHPCLGRDPPAYAPHNSSGVNYCYLTAHHPQWFLTDREGNRLAFADYPADMAVDIGRPGYRALWADNALGTARTDGFDGVYMDDVNTRPGHGLDGRLAAYGDKAYGQAMVGFVRSVGETLSERGLLTIANVGMNPTVAWQVDDTAAIARSVTAVNKEFYSHWGKECMPRSALFTDPRSDGNPDLHELEGLQQRIEARGGHLTGIDYGSAVADPAAMSYGRASFLLVWDGRPGSAYIFRTCGTGDPADPAWTTELGLPTAAARSISGAWLRPYTDGLVVLNPSPTVASTVPLDGSYVTPDGTRVTGRVSLRPASAVLLTRAGYS